jgi:hypothetical protein
MCGICPLNHHNSTETNFEEEIETTTGLAESGNLESTTERIIKVEDVEAFQLPKVPAM